MHKNTFGGWARGAGGNTALPRPLTGLRGGTRRERSGEEMEGEGSGREGR